MNARTKAVTKANRCDNLLISGQRSFTLRQGHLSPSSGAEGFGTGLSQIGHLISMVLHQLYRRFDCHWRLATVQRLWGFGDSKQRNAHGTNALRWLSACATQFHTKSPCKAMPQF